MQRNETTHPPRQPGQQFFYVAVSRGIYYIRGGTVVGDARQQPGRPRAIKFRPAGQFRDRQLGANAVVYSDPQTAVDEIQRIAETRGEVAGTIIHDYPAGFFQA